MTHSTSQARQALKDHLKKIADAQAAMDTAKAPIDRLEGLQLASQAAQSELSKFAAAEVATLSGWAARGQGAQPQPDHSARHGLEAKHTDAVATLKNAEQAAAGFQAALTDARLRHAELVTWIDGRIHDVLLEHASALIAKRKALELELAEVNAQVSGLRQVMGKDPTRAQFQELLRLDSRTDLPDANKAHQAAMTSWASLAQRLASNPAAM